MLKTAHYIQSLAPGRYDDVSEALTDLLLVEPVSAQLLAIE